MMPNINHAVLIGSSAERVYHAITNQEQLSKWWTAGAKVVATLNSIAYFPFGNGYSKEMVVTELKPFETVRWYCIKGADEWIGTDVLFQLIPGNKESMLSLYPEISGQIEQMKTEDATLVIFRHSNWKSETLMFAECNYTWGRFLRSLQLLCETGKGHPWPHQHEIDL
ncbi:SRPBCC domain-containing protein [Chryseobacterium indologenes]|uniref:SRPBCC family protein n=2 Tax=Chryseobacterium indologenes TaxID=253 RepID=UPI00110959B6|nr:SRPBCC domain-containing protein [Chryseobacterium indologenes]TLX25403.1 SRPBCC domain-containing protein [Chryseobacterium indologenes]